VKYIVIFHANLNYAYLTPDKYEFVIRKSYELILDTMTTRFPDTKYVFEASGYTLEQISIITPDVLGKLKTAVDSGQCEFMGSPYAHPMLPNFPEEDGVWSIRFSNEIYEKYLGLTPSSFWNPECGWRSYVPKQVAETGYTNLIGDFEAYSRSRTPGGTPNRPEIFKEEYTDDQTFYDFSFKYDLQGSEKTIHFPFENVGGVPKGSLRLFLRTDRVAQFAVRYFMGMPGYTFEAYMDLIKKFSQQKADEPEGALIIYADDAEYVGTNGWFRLKYQNKPDHVFEQTPESREKLVRLVEACKKIGEFITFDEACGKLPAIRDTIYFDDDSAWHGAKASTWASTPMAKLLRPWQDLVREKLKEIEAELSGELVHKIWYHLTNSYNSDGQWPPTLPEAPHIIHPENYRYCFENLLTAEMLVGGVDRSRLPSEAVQTMNSILKMQQDLIVGKANRLLISKQDGDVKNARLALDLISRSQAIQLLEKMDQKILYPAQYAARAYALMEARRLVGGIPIEKIVETGITDNLDASENV
jgi:alpha-amylase/alpha-mannosidase (GH57 family)